MSSVQALHPNAPSSWCPYATNNGDWVNTKVLKIGSNGTEKWKRYTQELSTGDLYGVPLNEEMCGSSKGDPEPPVGIALKCAGIFVATPFYMLGVMGVNALKIIVDISSIFWRIIPQFIEEFSTKKCIAAMGNFFMSINWDLPHAIMQDIWRVVRSPLYAGGMALACVYGIVSPYEGRKWISKIEGLWHEASYKMDFRLGMSKKYSLTQFISDIAKGKILFLAWCMQKRGNINDHRLGKRIYIQVK